MTRGPAPRADRSRRRQARPELRAARPVVVAARPIPPAPQGLLASTRAEWEALWASDLAAALAETSLPALERLFLLRDEWRRCMRAARKERLVAGSRGQPVVHPLAKRADELLSHIRSLEQEFGLTPLARVRLGLAATQARISIDELAAEADGGEDDEGDDPRMDVAAADS